MPEADNRQEQSRESSLSREGSPEERAPNAFDSSSVIDVTINRQPKDAYFNYNEESSLRRVRHSLSSGILFLTRLSTDCRKGRKVASSLVAFVAQGSSACTSKTISLRYSATLAPD